MTLFVKTPRRSMPARRAFTLIELMISIALVVVLILGVNKVFTYTAQAVGSGQAFNDATRNSRAIQSIFGNDFTAMVPNGSGPNDAACIILRSSATYAYDNAADYASQEPNSPSAPTGTYPTAAFQDFNNSGYAGDPSVAGDVTYPGTYNSRNHRLDTLSFFARDLFHRQTGNQGTFVDDMSTTEAWIWYGHLWLPDNTGNYFQNNTTTPTFPGLGNTIASNPNNFYASQFVLGRVQMVLKEKPSPTAAAPTITDNANIPQRYINRTADPRSLATLHFSDTTPFSPGASAAPANGDSSSWLFQDSRFDLAAASITGFRNKLANYTAYYGAGTAWWDNFMTGNPSPRSLNPSGANLGTRFRCNPFVAKPMDAESMAQAVPYFLGGCSQFIVEYAGDFLNQDNSPGSATYGRINAGTALAPAQPDNEIDYVLIPPASGGGGIPRSQWRKQILWYGLPRSTSGLGTIDPINNGDVVPLSYWLQKYRVYSSYTFEKLVPPYQSIPNNYIKNDSTANPYVCAFGPNDPKPSLIRITITLNDPTGRLPAGQTYQYVFPVP